MQIRSKTFRLGVAFLTICTGLLILLLGLPKFSSQTLECEGVVDDEELDLLLDQYANYRAGGRRFLNILFSDKSLCIQPYYQSLITINPTHPEGHLALSLGYAQRNDFIRSTRHTYLARLNGISAAHQALAFKIIPEPSMTTSILSGILNVPDYGLIHGPMIGNLQPTSVDLWIRTDGPTTVQAFASPAQDLDQSIASTKLQTYQKDDFTARLRLSNLQPETSYSYWISINGAETSDSSWKFVTPPKAGNPVVVQIGFSGGADYIPPFERMWTTLSSEPMDAFFLMGDNVYIDAPKNPTVQRYIYYRRQFRPEFDRFIASTPIYAIWDDHDFADNNSYGGPEADHPTWKRAVFDVFQENWVNPAYGDEPDHPGIWFSHSIGDLEFFFLDGRYYRTKPGSEGPASMLGDYQRQWLLSELSASEATFKFIISPVPWSIEANDAPDAWNAYLSERELIFDHIQDHRIDGVVLLSADRHRSDLWRIEQLNSYDFFEFESSRLTNHHTHSTKDQAIFSYNEKPSFGYLIIDTIAAEPTIKFQIISIDDEIIFEHSISLSQISFAN